MHTRARRCEYVCANFGRSHGQRIRIYPLLGSPLQGQGHFCPRQRVYKARDMNWRFTLIVRQEVRVCRINSHSRETPGFEYTVPSRERGGEGFQLSPPAHPQKYSRKKHGVNSFVLRTALHNEGVLLCFTNGMTNRPWLVRVKFALTRWSCSC